MINFGYRLRYLFERPTPLLLRLHVHAAELHALVRADDMRIEPYVDAQIYHDGFGNTCTRIEAPAGELCVSADGWLDESLLPQAPHPFAKEHPLSLLPDEALVMLRASAYCDVDSVRQVAHHWFGSVAAGWQRVQAVTDFVHRQQESGIPATDTAAFGWKPPVHLAHVSDAVHYAMAICRAINIPARYCLGYVVGDALEAAPSPSDFTPWFEAYLGGGWLAFDPRAPKAAVHRITIAHGRDAGDVAVCTAFAPSKLAEAQVWARRQALPTRRRANPSADNFLDERFGALPLTEHHGSP